MEDVHPQLPAQPGTGERPRLVVVGAGDMSLPLVSLARKRGRGVLEMLRAQGVAPERLARVQVPVGLDIGAQTPAEIALSVVAQIVAVRSGRPGTALAERAP